MSNLKIKNSYSKKAGAAPTILDFGEIAINVQDEILYFSGKDGKPIPLKEVPDPLKVQTITIAEGENTTKTIRPQSKIVLLDIGIENNPVRLLMYPPSDIDQDKYSYNIDKEFTILIRHKSGKLTDGKQFVIFESLNGNSYLYRFEGKETRVVKAYCDDTDSLLITYQNPDACYPIERKNSFANLVMRNGSNWVVVDGNRTERDYLNVLKGLKINGYTIEGFEIIPQGFNLKRSYDAAKNNTFMTKDGNGAFVNKAIMMSLTSPSKNLKPDETKDPEVRWGDHVEACTSNDYKTLPQKSRFPMDVHSGLEASVLFPKEMPWLYAHNIGEVHELPMMYDRDSESIEINNDYGKSDIPSCATLDFDGYAKSHFILNNIDYEIGMDDFVAGYDCYRYSGTTTTDGWYLPSCGEMIFVLPLIGKINRTVSFLDKNKSLFNIEVESLKRMTYWTCTEASKNEAFVIDFENGAILQETKLNNAAHRLRAFRVVGGWMVAEKA